MRSRNLLGMWMILGVISWSWGIEPASARPSTSACKQRWSRKYKEKVIKCTYRGGKRLVRRFAGRWTRRPRGACWDYDVVALQRCGCRLFKRASICCWRNNKRSCPEIRVGASRRVDCRKYGMPRYGRSGNKLDKTCLARRAAAKKNRYCRKSSFKSVTPGPAGTCKDSIKIHCKSPRQLKRYLANKCGPAVSDCKGCRVIRKCSSKRGLACYQRYLKRKGRATRIKQGLGGVRTSIRGLFVKMRKAIKAKNTAAFRALWYPEGYKRNLTGSGGMSGRKMFRSTQKKSWVPLIKGKAKAPFGQTGAWLVTIEGKTSIRRYRGYFSYTAVVVRHKGKYLMLGLSSRPYTVSALAKRWIKQKGGK